MPNFIIPLLYRNTGLMKHEVTQLLTCPLITAGVQGEIVIWRNEHWEPQILIYPNLSDCCGSLILFFRLRIPLFNILDKVEECLVTLHEDLRVRIFDIRDGRCIGVSPHDTFNEMVYQCQPLSANQCRFLVFCGHHGLYLFDLWKMKCVKEYLGTFSGLCRIDNNTVCAIDDQNALHIINMSPLNHECYLNYSEYLKRHEQIVEEFKQFKINDGLQLLNLQYIPTQKRLLKLHYHPDKQLLTIVMGNQVWLIFDIYTQPIYIQFYQARNQYRFSDIKYHQTDQHHVLLMTRTGEFLPINMKDIMYLLKQTKEQDDFVYGFKEFQFTKVAGQPVGKVLLNFTSPIQGQPLQLSKSLRKHTSRIAITDSLMNCQIFQFKNKCINVYNLSDLMHNYDIDLFTKDIEHTIELKNCDLRFRTLSPLANNIPFWNDAIPLYSFNLLSTYNNSLIHNLNQLLSSQFKQQYMGLLNTQLANANVTSTYISTDPINPIYWFGCDNGMIYGFPMSFNHKYVIYVIKFDNSPIKFILHKHKYIFVSSGNGKFATMHYEAIQQQQNQSLEYSNLVPQIETTLSAPACKTLRIYQLLNESYDTDPDEIKQQNEIIVHKQPTQAICLENNTIILVSLDNGKIMIKLHGVSETTQISGLYYDDQADLWNVLSDDGAVSVYDEKGKYLRTIAIEQYHSLFQVEQKLQKLWTKFIQYHKISDFKREFNKSISSSHLFLEFTQRYPNLYEIAGQINNMEFQAVNALKILLLIDKHSYKSSSKACQFLKTSIGEIEWWDLKKPIHNSNDLAIQNRLFSIIYPWDIDQQLDEQVESFLNQRPVFQPYIGIQSLGYAFSFVLNNRWSASEYLTSIMSMSLMHFYINQSYKNNSLYTNLMFQTVELLTKKKRLLDSNFKPLNIEIMAGYVIDEQNEVMTAACNLIISAIINKEQDIPMLQIKCRDLIGIQMKKQGQNYSNIEIILLVIEAYISTFYDKALPPQNDILMRVVAGIDLKNCVVNPHLCAPLLKTLVDGMEVFKKVVQPPELLKALFFMFFNYNTVLDYMDTLRENYSQSRRGLNILEEFNKQPDEMKKRMKQLIVKAIIHTANLQMQDFYSIIRKDILNLEMHILYPCSIIDLIRNYIKSQQWNVVKHLPFLIEIILKSLDPNNPNLRRVCHRAATNALQTICKLFHCVSFHQITQKIALGSAENQIIIYDLRTAVKWRVLDGHEGQVAALGFDNTGRQLASFSFTDWKVKIWKVGSTGFFGSILGIQGRSIKDFAVRRQGEGAMRTSIVWNQEDSRVFLKLGEVNLHFDI